MCEKRPNEPWLAYMCRYVVEQPRAVLAVIGIAAAIVLYCDLRSFIAGQAWVLFCCLLFPKNAPGADIFVCPWWVRWKFMPSA